MSGSSSSRSPFLCDANSFCAALKKCFTHKVEAKQPGQTEKGALHMWGRVRVIIRVRGLG